MKSLSCCPLKPSSLAVKFLESQSANILWKKSLLQFSDNLTVWLSYTFCLYKIIFFSGKNPCLWWIKFSCGNTGLFGTAIIPAWLQDICFLSADEWWDLKRKERILICKILKVFINGQCTSNPVNYFSNFLSP